MTKNMRVKNVGARGKAGGGVSRGNFWGTSWLQKVSYTSREMLRVGVLAPTVV